MGQWDPVKDVDRGKAMMKLGGIVALFLITLTSCMAPPISKDSGSLFIDSNYVKRHYIYGTGDAIAADLGEVRYSSGGMQDAGGTELVDIPIKNKSVENYLAAVVDRLQKHWPGTPRKFHVELTGGVNYDASSVSTSQEDIIRVQSGVLLLSASEDEIAALLAHEMAHHYLRHARRTRYVNSLNRITDDLIDMVVGSFMHRASIGASKASSKYEIRKDLVKTVSSTEYVTLLNKFSIALSSSPWSRADEITADRLGVDLLQKSGYKLQGMGKFLGQLQEEEDAAKLAIEFMGKNLAVTLTQRINQELGESSYEDKMIFKERLQNVVGASAIKLMLHSMDSLHKSPEKRIEEFQKYAKTRAEYRQQLRTQKARELDKKSLEKIVKAGENRQWYKSTTELRNILVKNENKAIDDEELRRYVQKFIKSGYLSPLVRYWKYRLVMEGKLKGDKKKEILGVSSWAGSYVFPYDKAVSDALERKMIKEAWSIIRVAKERIGIAYVWPMLYRYYLVTGDLEKAESAIEQCVNIGDRTVKAICSELAIDEHAEKYSIRKNKFIESLRDELEEQVQKLKSI